LKERANTLDKEFFLGKNLEQKGRNIDMSKVVDLVNEEELLNEIDPDSL